MSRFKSRIEPTALLGTYRVLALSILCGLCLASCSREDGITGVAGPENEGSPAPDLASLAMDPSEAVVEEGRQLSFAGAAYTDEGSRVDVPLVWSSSDPRVGTVSAEGEFHAKGMGTTWIHVTAGEIRDSAEVRVGQSVSTSGGRLSSDDGKVKLVVPEGALEEQLIITIRSRTYGRGEGLVGGTVHEFLPEDVRFAEPMSLQLSYHENELADATDESQLAVHTLTPDGWERLPTTSVDTVSNIMSTSINHFSLYAAFALATVSSLQVSPERLELVPGESRVLQATATNENGDRLQVPVTWKSSDPSVATVGFDGMVTARREGAVSITAAADGIEASTSVVVSVDGPQSQDAGLAIGLHQDLTWDGWPERRQNAIRAATSVGAEVSRSSLLWHLIEPEEGRRDWSRVDAVVSELEAAGMEIVFAIYGSPRWASGAPAGLQDHWAYVPENPEAFEDWVDAYARFVEDLVRRYRDRVEYWELWNEPNLHYFWKPTPDPVRFARWYEAVEDAVEAGDPDALTGLGGLSSPCCVGPEDVSGLEFLRSLYEEGLRPDAVGVHPYPDQSQPPDVEMQWENNFRDIRLIRDVMEEFGQSDARIWVTEWGWSTDRVTESDQARYVHRSLEILRDEFPGVTLATYFLDYDRGEEYPYGLFREDFSPKAAAASFREFLTGTAGR